MRFAVIVVLLVVVRPLLLSILARNSYVLFYRNCHNIFDASLVNFTMKCNGTAANLQIQTFEPISEMWFQLNVSSQGMRNRQTDVYTQMSSSTANYCAYLVGESVHPFYMMFHRAILRNSVYRIPENCPVLPDQYYINNLQFNETTANAMLMSTNFRIKVSVKDQLQRRILFIRFDAAVRNTAALLRRKIRPL